MEHWVELFPGEDDDGGHVDDGAAQGQEEDGVAHRLLVHCDDDSRWSLSELLSVLLNQIYIFALVFSFVLWLELLGRIKYSFLIQRRKQDKGLRSGKKVSPFCFSQPSNLDKQHVQRAYGFIYVAFLNEETGGRKINATQSQLRGP